MPLDIPDSLSGLDLFRYLHERMAAIFEAKNTDYAGASHRQADPWANFRHAEKLGIPAYLGAWVRKIDKEVRAKNVHASGTAVLDETLADTFFDDAVYSLIVLSAYVEFLRSGQERPSLPLAYARQSEIVQRIVDAIWNDVADRSGFDLDGLDEDVQQEIRETWQRLIADAILAPPGVLPPATPTELP